MSGTTIHTVIQNDGELHLSQLPFRKGDRVQAVISVVDAAAQGEVERDKARRKFLELAKTSDFCSQSPYPTRDELHERH